MVQLDGDNYFMCDLESVQVSDWNEMLKKETKNIMLKIPFVHFSILPV